MQPRTAIKITPADHGRRMRLNEFEFAQVQEGYNYELGRGVITVSDVAHPDHGAQVEEIRDQLTVYKLRHRDQITHIFDGGSCKILVPEYESERHPDIVIYKRPHPKVKNIWRVWLPDVVIEVVSRHSKQRDYVEKKEEYLNLGIREYWIVDADKRQILALRRRGEKWVPKVVRPGEIYQTKLLPGFELDVAAVFKATEEV